jgi:hypothetical protein
MISHICACFTWTHIHHLKADSEICHIRFCLAVKIIQLVKCSLDFFWGGGGVYRRSDCIMEALKDHRIILFFHGLGVINWGHNFLCTWGSYQQLRVYFVGEMMSYTVHNSHGCDTVLNVHATMEDKVMTQRTVAGVSIIWKSVSIF